MSLISFESKQETELVTNYIKESGAVPVFNLFLILINQVKKKEKRIDRRDFLSIHFKKNCRNVSSISATATNHVFNNNLN
jgi:hypothetical protein